MIGIDLTNPISIAMNNVVLTAADHYYASSIMDECPGPCQVCLAVKVLEELVGEEALAEFVNIANEKIAALEQVQK